MERKRLPNEHSLDELLEIASDEEVIKKEDEVIVRNNNDVLSFVLAFNLQPGNEIVPTRLLYKLYRGWSKSPIAKELFYNLLGEIFIPLRGRVKINESSINISIKLYDKYRIKKDFRYSNASHRKHVLQFLSEREITSGDIWLPAYVIYHMYDKWCYDNNKATRFSEIAFKNVLITHLKTNKNIEKDGIYFKVDKSIFNHLTEETINNLKEARKKRHGRKEKKEPKKSK